MIIELARQLGGKDTILTDEQLEYLAFDKIMDKAKTGEDVNSPDKKEATEIMYEEYLGNKELTEFCVLDYEAFYETR